MLARTASLSIVLSALLAACGGGNGGGTDAGPMVGMDAGISRDAGGAMACATAGPEDNAAACMDGCDNEPDGFADCDDFQCCSLRTDCPADSACGRMMPRDAGTPMQCPGAVEPENTVAACSDGCSNDDDGAFDGGAPRIFVDCNDIDCCGVVTCAPGTFCGDRRDGGPRDSGTCMDFQPENFVGACTNGCDDDGNGFTDCRDRGCCLVLAAAGMTCPSGTFCNSYTPPAGLMLCAGDDVSMPPGREATLAACSDGCDNDRNGFQDCGDRNCCLIRSAGGTACGAGTFCADTFMAGSVNLCAGDDVSMPPGTEDDATSCGNDCDDDRDGFEDCNDRSCCDARTDCPAGTFCGDR